jgi:hypothetical protein
MFQTKPTNTTIVVTKNSEPDNVPINVIIVVATRSQVPKQQALRDCESVKEKKHLINKHRNNCVIILFILSSYMEVI